MTIKERLRCLLDTIEEDQDTDCAEELIEQFMKDNGIQQYKISVDDMFDNPGVDIYSLSVAYILNGELELLVGSISVY